MQTQIDSQHLHLDQILLPKILRYHNLKSKTMAQPQKSVLITGCSEGGIGDGLAKAFHQKGLRVFATARNLSKIKHFKALGIETLQLDVTDDASIKEAVQTVTDLTNGNLDFLVNNSGGGKLASCIQIFDPY